MRWTKEEGERCLACEREERQHERQESDRRQAELERRLEELQQQVCGWVGGCGGVLVQL